MKLERKELEEMLKQACASVGHKEAVSMPTDVGIEFARLIAKRSQSQLRDAAAILVPSLEMALAMGSVDGPANMVADVRRGYELLVKASC